jgi:hypothetical protein
VVTAGEVHRGHDIGAAGGQHRVRAGLGGERIGPAEGLGQVDAFVDEKGIRQVLAQLDARGTADVGFAHQEGRLHLH